MKYIYFLVLSYFAFMPIYSLEVNRDIIITDEVVEFENYVGPYLFYNTVEEIRGIGSFLSNNITPGLKGNADYSGKYFMFHRPKLEWEEMINSCDVFKISEEALIDNIENIKLILSQYLIDSYGYSIEDSDLLAQLLVVYNAVYRGDAEHFKTFYTTEGVVTDEIRHLGIDRHYYNWPGKTNIYIPLSSTLIPGKLTNIDTDNILDSDVIDYIKENEEDEITFREEIVEYKEREFDEVKKDIDDKEKVILEKKEEIESRIEVSEEDESLKSQLEEVKVELEEIEDERKDLEEKEEKILELRDEIAKDKNADISSEAPLIQENKIVFILNKNIGGEKYGQVIYINNSGDIITKGEVNTVRNNRYYIIGDYIYIIAGGKTGNRIVSVGKINISDLTVNSWGNIACYEKSGIYEYRGFIYCIISESGAHYIGEFDNDLKLIRKSSLSVDKDSFVALNGGIFYIQGEDNSIKLVNLSDFVSVLEE